MKRFGKYLSIMELFISNPLTNFLFTRTIIFKKLEFLSKFPIALWLIIKYMLLLSETEFIFMHFVPLWWIKILSPQSHKMQKDDPRVAGIILGIGTIFVGPDQAVMRAPTTGIVLK